MGNLEYNVNHIRCLHPLILQYPLIIYHNLQNHRDKHYRLLTSIVSPVDEYDQSYIHLREKYPSTIISWVVIRESGVTMSDAEEKDIPMAECGSCRAIIPLDSKSAPNVESVFLVCLKRRLESAGHVML